MSAGDSRSAPRDSDARRDLLASIDQAFDEARLPDAGRTATSDPFSYLRDRGPGVPTSYPDLYVTPGELVLAPSFTFLENRGYQYSPNEFDIDSPDDFLGKLRTSQGALFLAYGVSDSVSVGLRAAAGEATFNKAPEDPTAVPGRVHETGLIDLRPEIWWRFLTESGDRPEVSVFLAASAPHDRGNRITGTQDWVLYPGFQVVKGFPFATLVARLGFEADFASGSTLDFGGWMLEAQRRLSDRWWVSAGLDGLVGGGSNFDEVYLTAAVLWQPTPRFGVRFRPRLGLTSMTEGWGFEFGLVFNLDTH